MRDVSLREKMKRGCQYCKDMVAIPRGMTSRTSCPHDECLYHVLDKYESYEEFMASEDSKILVDGFFSSAANCYELSNGNATVKQVFGNKDFRGFL